MRCTGKVLCGIAAISKCSPEPGCADGGAQALIPAPVGNVARNLPEIDATSRNLSRGASYPVAGRDAIAAPPSVACTPPKKIA